MPKTLEVTADGARSTFTRLRLSRARLYGSRRRIPVDAQGRPCATAALTRDGRYVLPAGATATLYLDDEGDVVERQDLRAVGDDGEPVEPGATFLDGRTLLVETAGPTDMLDHAVTHVYVLDPVSVAPALDAALAAGAVYRVRTTDARSAAAAFLLKNDVGFFLLVGEPTGFDFIGPEHADRSPPEGDEPDGDWDDLDFDMI